MSNLIKEMMNGLRLKMSIAKMNVGGEVINVDAKQRDALPPTSIVQDDFNFARPNNLMEADFEEPLIESGRFGDHDEWNKHIKMGMQVTKMISSEEDYDQSNYSDDVGEVERDVNYAKPDYGQIKTAMIENISFEEQASQEDNQNESSKK